MRTPIRSECRGCASTNTKVVIRSKPVGKGRIVRGNVRLARDLVRMNKCRDCGDVGLEYGPSTPQAPEVLPNPQVVGSLKLLRRSGLVYPWERGLENKL